MTFNQGIKKSLVLLQGSFLCVLRPDQAFLLISRRRMSISRKSCHEHPNSHGQVTTSPKDMKE